MRRRMQHPSLSAQALAMRRTTTSRPPRDRSSASYPTCRWLGNSDPAASAMHALPQYCLTSCVQAAHKVEQVLLIFLMYKSCPYFQARGFRVEVLDIQRKDWYGFPPDFASADLASKMCGLKAWDRPEPAHRCTSDLGLRLPQCADCLCHFTIGRACCARC